jgi:hypothetical protein
MIFISVEADLHPYSVMSGLVLEQEHERQLGVIGYYLRKPNNEHSLYHAWTINKAKNKTTALEEAQVIDDFLGNVDVFSIATTSIPVSKINSG